MASTVTRNLRVKPPRQARRPAGPVRSRPGEAGDGRRQHPTPPAPPSYETLYRHWERGAWRAAALHFGEDARQWRECLSDFERTAALWSYALFLWGEDAVATSLAPYIDAAPRAEQKYLLAAQQADEARHAVFFNRFLHEVCGVGDGTVAAGLAAMAPQLTPGLRAILQHLDAMVARLRGDPSPSTLAAAVTLYHVVIEAAMAQSGQQMIIDDLKRRELLPAFRAGMLAVKRDERRHVAFGVRLLADLRESDPGVPRAVARLLRDVIPFTCQVLMPPGWDESYVACFGHTFDSVGTLGVRSLTRALQRAGMPLHALPGPPVLPRGLSDEQAATRGRELVQAGIAGVRDGPSRRDAGTLELLFDTMTRVTDADHGLRRATTFQWEFTDPDVPPWHVTVDGAQACAAQGVARRPDLRLRVAYQDWVDVVARRLSVARALATGRLRARGSPLAVARLARVYPQG